MTEDEIRDALAEPDAEPTEGKDAAPPANDEDEREVAK